MCGRYALKVLSFAQDAAWQAQLQREFGGYERYNIAPTATVPWLRLGGDGIVEAVAGRWGLVPAFARGEPAKGFSMHNARAETVAGSGAFRVPWQRRQRCLVPATGFYEWHQDERGKFPFFIRDVDEAGLVLGGLWDRSVRDDGQVIESCTILTLPANELMADVHNTGNHPGRMPLILPRADWQDWLTVSPDAARELVTACPSETLFAYRVATRVNNARNDDAALIAPAPD